MVSNIISGTLIFVFSIILSREIGAKGMGLYQLVIPLYTMLIFVTGGGISVTMSRIAAEKKATGRLKELYRTVRVICIIEVAWSILVTGVIMLSANFIAMKFLSDSRTYYSILAFCPALIMTSISSTYRGTYYGIQRVIEPGIIDIIEKIIKIILVCPMVIVAGRVSMELATGAAMLALSCGEFISFLLFFTSFKHYKRNNPAQGICDNDYQLIFNVIKIALPISIEGIVSAIFSTIIAILIPKRLQSAGISYEEALGLLGKLQGMAINIAFFPMLITTAFNMMLVPSITETVKVRNNKILNHRINSAIKLGAVTSFLTAAIILGSPQKIGNYFYKDEMVGKILYYIAPVLPLVYIEYVSYAILNGLGEQTKLLINSIVVQTIDVILLYIFVGISVLNINGYALNMGISSSIGIYLNYKLIIKTSGFKIDWVYAIIVPMLCGTITYVISSNLIFKLFNVPITIIVSIIIYCIFYIPANRILR